MKKKKEITSFLAHLHHSHAALQVYADGDAKLALSIPSTELANVAKTLLLLKGKVFKVHLMEAELEEQESSKPKIETEAYQG